MMKLTKNPKRMERRVEKLKSLGFIIIHEDSNVQIPLANGQNFEADFSAIDENKFIQVAIRKAYIEGLNNGEENIRERMKNLIGVK